MIRQCEEHGYFRGELCPVCGKEGKFILNDYETERLGKTLAGALRHFPEKFDLTMDPKGWVDVRQFVNAVRSRQRRFKWLRPYHIVALITTDPKGRYQYKDGYIRATYGHTIDVKLDDLPEADVDVLYYPVTEEEVDIILESGLFPSDRKKVHLSGSVEKAKEAGRVRTENPIILKIDAKKAKEDGIKIYRAGKDVYVADSIDKKYISLLEEGKR